MAVRVVAPTKSPTWSSLSPPWGRRLDMQHPMLVGLIGCWSLPNTTNLVSGQTGVQPVARVGEPVGISTQTFSSDNQWGPGLYFPNIGIAGVVCPAEFNGIKDSNLTVSCWCRPLGTGGVSSNGKLVDQGTDGVGTGGWSLYNTGTAFRWRINGSATVCDSAAGAWRQDFTTLVTGTARLSGTSTAQVIYVNGLRSNTATPAATVPATACTIPIGIGDTAVSSAASWNGWIWDVRIWRRTLTDAEVWSLYDPNTRHDIYQMPSSKKFFFLRNDDPPASNAVIPPPANIPQRPEAIALNPFSPQARGLYGWYAAKDGALVGMHFNSHDTGTLSSSELVNTPSKIWRSKLPIGLTSNINVGPAAPEVPFWKWSDMGDVPVSYKRQEAQGFNPSTQQSYIETDLFISGTEDAAAGVSDFSLVYWVYPLVSPYNEATYWSWNPVAGPFRLSSASLVIQGTTHSCGEIHQKGRWQMITIARGRNAGINHNFIGVRIWRDATLVFEDSATSVALAGFATAPTFSIGGGDSDQTSQGVDAVNAMWADFRFYTRAWTQTDVDYAFNPKTRWDYYLQPGAYKPYYKIVTTGGTTYFVTPSGALIPIGTLSNTDLKVLPGSITPTGALAKSDSKPIAGSITPTGLIAKSDQKPFTGSLIPSGSETRSAGKGLSGSLTPTGAETKDLSKGLSGSVSPSASIAKSDYKSFAGGMIPTGVESGEVGKILGGNIRPTGSLLKSILKYLIGSLSPSGSFSSLLAHFISLAGSLMPNGAMVRDASKDVSGSLDPSGNTLKDVSSSLSGQIGFSGSVSKRVLLLLSGTIGLVGTLTRVAFQLAPHLLTSFGRYVPFLGSFGKHEQSLESLGKNEESVDAFGSDDEN